MKVCQSFLNKRILKMNNRFHNVKVFQFEVYFHFLNSNNKSYIAQLQGREISKKVKKGKTESNLTHLANRVFLTIFMALVNWMANTENIANCHIIVYGYTYRHSIWTIWTNIIVVIDFGMSLQATRFVTPHKMTTTLNLAMIYEINYNTIGMCMFVSQCLVRCVCVH